VVVRRSDSALVSINEVNLRPALLLLGWVTMSNVHLQTSTMLKVLHLAKKVSHRLTAAKCATYNIFLTSVNRIIKYNLR